VTSSQPASLVIIFKIDPSLKVETLFFAVVVDILLSASSADNLPVGGFSSPNIVYWLPYLSCSEEYHYK
jgi:hypothetical protein